MKVESHLNEGGQSIKDPKDLKYGISITDACHGWEATESMLRHGAEVLRKAAGHPAGAQAAAAPPACTPA
jgi:3-deoxy-7-phosphoheptulonate synthase